MTDFIERDAQASTPEASTPLPSHAPDAMKSFVATPRMDLSLTQKVLSWWKSELKPGMHIVRKEGDPLRYMFLITSNSYEDREKETITTSALKAYEESCYPGEGLYHNPNHLVYWHDEDVVMGDIVAVNVSGPFLTEVVREADTPVAKVLWDVAEQTDDAGVSHRFGYMEKDRDPDGTYHHIYKGDTTWLPKRDLAANSLTYAGVIKGMASPQSDKWLDETFERITGIKNASAKLHAKTGELEKELTAAGIQHKAAKPPMMPPVEADVAEAPADPEEDTKAARPEDMGAQLQVMNQIYTLVMELVAAQTGQMDEMGEFAKALKALTDTRSAEQTAEKALRQSLEDQVKALAQRVEIAEKRLSLVPRSVTTQAGDTPEAVKVAVDVAEKARADGEFEDVPGWGKLKKLP